MESTSSDERGVREVPRRKRKVVLQEESSSMSSDVPEQKRVKKTAPSKLDSGGECVKVPRKTAVKRSSAEEDKNICASTITQRKIGRYFGQINYSQSEVQLPKDGHHSTIINVMLQAMKTQLLDEEIELSLPESYEEMKAINIANTPKEFTEQFCVLREVYTDIMRTLISTAPQVPEKRKDWYRRLKNIVLSEGKHQRQSRNSRSAEYVRMRDMLLSLESLCDLELETTDRSSNHSHIIWCHFWQCLFASLDTSSSTAADGTVTDGRLVRKGECEEVLVVNPVPQNKYDAPKSINITVKPDFLLCTKREVMQNNELMSQLRVAVVGEIQAPSFDGSESPQSDSDHFNNKSQPQLEKEKTCPGDSGQDTIGPSLECTADVEKDQIKSNKLEKMKTQHFTELLCMMRRSWRSLKYETCSDHMFGWYSVKNKVYFTCLVAKTAKKSFYCVFLSQENAEDYLAQNKEPSPNLFKQFCFPPLDVFLPEHFEALFEFLNYLVWGRKSR